MSIAFEKSVKTYLGFLQVRGKALNTLKNYECDLRALGDFCNQKKLDFQNLSLANLEAYHEHLKSLGLRPNSRRRKLITAKTFLRYLSGRIDVSVVGVEKLVPPDKIEKPPKLVPRRDLLKIQKEQPDTDMGWRNRALIGVLLETGMIVTEALSLRQEDCHWREKHGVLAGAGLKVNGKRARMVQVSSTTAQALKQLSRRLKGKKYFFYGYSRSGPNAEKLTPRGVEILFKEWSKTYELAHLHPRTLRHLYVVQALLKGKTQAEIMEYIGLRTPYSFRIYKPLMDEVQNKKKVLRHEIRA